LGEKEFLRKKLKLTNKMDIELTILLKEAQKVSVKSIIE
jgi:hypothetical protein